MASSWILIGLPLVLFVVLDCLGGLKAGLIGAIMAAILELGFSYYITGGIDWTSIVSVILIVGLALWSMKQNTSVHIKTQPAIMSFIISVLFLVSYISGMNYLYEMMVKYREIFPAQQQIILSNPATPYFMELMTLYGGMSFLLHGFFMLWAAKKKSNLFWLVARVIGTFVACMIAIICARLHMGAVGYSI